MTKLTVLLHEIETLPAACIDEVIDFVTSLKQNIPHKQSLKIPETKLLNEAALSKNFDTPIEDFMNEYEIMLVWDDEAQKWYAQNDDIPIMLEDGSIDTLINRVKLAAPEMLEINNMPYAGIHLVFKMESEAVLA